MVVVVVVVVVVLLILMTIGESMDNSTVHNFGGENTQLLPRSVACSRALEPARIITFRIKQNKKKARARLPASITHPREAGAGNSHNAAGITHALHKGCGADVSARNVALEHAVVTGGGGGYLRRKCGLNIILGVGAGTRPAGTAARAGWSWRLETRCAPHLQRR